MKMIEGETIADQIRLEIAQEMQKPHNRKPKLVAIQVGDNPASTIYIRNKIRACEEVGFESRKISLEVSCDKESLLETIESLNRDPSVDGILLQLPLPSHLETNIMVQAISPTKDVDGLHPTNLGLLLSGEKSGFAPCTPLGVRELLIRSKISIRGKHVVIVGRSNIVGKPLAALLIQKAEHADATVTIAHSRSQNLAQITREADILVAAMGVPQFIQAEMVKRGAVVIDVGINRNKEAKLVGDVDFHRVKERCSFISPVPKGVGPMTIAMLLRNTLIAFQRNQKLEVWKW